MPNTNAPSEDTARAEVGAVCARERGRSRGRPFHLPTTLILALTLLLSSCNHLFYYPDQVEHLTPARADPPLSFHSYAVAVEPGVQLALWHIPAVPGVPRRGVVVQFHGNAENMSSHFLFVAWLAREGFDVVTFDYRGYGASTGDPDREGLVRDGLAVLDWVARAPELAGPKIAVLGQSLGGAVAVPVVVRAPLGRVAALVVESTFDSYRYVAQVKLAGSLVTWPLQVPLSHLVTDELSPIDSARRLTVPFLVIHARGDRVVPIVHGRRLFRAAPRGHKEFWEIASDAHLAAFGDPASPYRARLVAFLEDAFRTPHAADDDERARSKRKRDKAAAAASTARARDASDLAAAPHAW